MAANYSIAAPRIRAAITRSGATQKEVAAMLTISEQYLSDICRGRRTVSAYVAVRLEVVLGLSAHKIMIDQALEELKVAWADFTPGDLREMPLREKVTA